MRTDTFVRLIVVALMVFFLSACENGGGNPVSPGTTDGECPPGNPGCHAVAPPAGGIYTWSVPVGSIATSGGNRVIVPADCIKAELVAIDPPIGGTLSSAVGTRAYIKWKLTVCAEAPNPIDGQGYRLNVGITNFGDIGLLTSFGGGAYGPVFPGESKELGGDSAWLVSTSGLPAVMPAFCLGIAAKGGWLTNPDAIGYPKTWFVLDWKRG
jgi:hypothetical protein